jgi:myo-inositol-1-phosphate synthase
VRCCKLALNHKLKGALVGPSAYFKKSPPVQYTDEEARRMTEEFIEKYRQSGAPGGQPQKDAATGAFNAPAEATTTKTKIGAES